MSELVRRELKESASVIASIDDGQVLKVAETLVKVFKAKRKVVLFGNGGSAADAQHIAAEFSGRYLMERAPLNALALTNLSSITAIGNDYSYETVFERQVEGTVREGDAVIGISTSGNSRNVLRAVQKAKELGAVTIGFSGSSGRLREVVDLPLVIASKSTPRVQEGYMAAAHVICGLVEKGVFGRRAVFIDRDDTIAKDVPYCPSPDKLELFGGVGRSVKRLNDAGFLVIVITNQSGVSRGFFTESDLSRIHDKMRLDLARDDARLDGVYFCPHLPDEGCECRKPNIGMVLQALEDFDIDLQSSYVIGDSDREMELARRIGAKGVQVTKDLDFNQAVDLILKER
ncbi:MAG TPA: HAD-IIIA family hydrolase [Methanomassiliicoccales archaeon]|nr:HAD-IIIA family hydrolase [Methanomassiliicoccales archaeon]